MTKTSVDPAEWSRPADIEIAEAQGSGLLLRVVGHFDLIRDGASVAVGGSVRRLLGLLAVEDRPLDRGFVAARLWPDVPKPRADANLRSTVWRLHHRRADVASVSTTCLQLTPQVTTDIRIVRGVISWLLDPSQETTQARLSLAMRANLHEDPLCDWYDEWVIDTRERFRQQRIHALEALAERLIAVGWYGAGVDAAMAAIECDLLRESGYAILVRAYLAEGNYGEAVRCVENFRALLRSELDLEPSLEFMALLDRSPDGPWRRSTPDATAHRDCSPTVSMKIPGLA